MKRDLFSLKSLYAIFYWCFSRSCDEMKLFSMLNKRTYICECFSKLSMIDLLLSGDWRGLIFIRFRFQSLELSWLNRDSNPLTNISWSFIYLNPKWKIIFILVLKIQCDIFHHLFQILFRQLWNSLAWTFMSIFKDYKHLLSSVNTITWTAKIVIPAGSLCSHERMHNILQSRTRYTVCIIFIEII